MSFKRILLVKFSRVAGLAVGGALLLGASGLSSCSKYQTFRGTGPDCTAEQDYNFWAQGLPGDVLTLDDASTWFQAADYTPDGGVTALDAGRSTVAYAWPPTNEQIPDLADAGLCTEYSKAMVFRASHNNDWGGLFGNYQFGITPLDASAWDGISFWARSPGETTKGFTFILDDDNTTAPTLDSNGNLIPSFCTDYGGSSTTASPGSQPVNDVSTGATASSSATRVPYPDECGNDYAVAVEVTTDWHFYTIPFSAFQQSALPNRVPNAIFRAGDVPGTGLLRNRLRHPTIRMTREAEMELWIAHLALYSKKGSRKDAAVGGDVVRRDVAQSDRAPADLPQRDLPSVDATPVDESDIDVTAMDGSESDSPSIDALEVDVAQN